MDYNKLCINCMRQKPAGAHICPYCKFDDRTYSYSPHVLQPFTPLKGKYIIGKMLGAGGFGITYIAMDTALDRVVCVKEFFVQQSMYRHTTISSDVSVSAVSQDQQKIYEVNRIKFEQEAKTLAKLTNTPGIVKVYDFFRENNTSYMVLELLSGMTLKDYVKKQGGRLPVDEVIKKLSPIMTSLDLLHKTTLISDDEQGQEYETGQWGIIHRDISPDNIMVSDDGTLTLFDFGGAKIQHEIRSCVILAKAGYSPIEQVQSTDETGPWVDVYAMAATIYYCLCGHIPVESTRRIADKDPLVKPSAEGVKLTSMQEQVLLKGLALRYKDRYLTMGEFRDALLNPESASPSKSIKWLAVAIPLAIAALAAGIFWTVKNLNEKSTVPAVMGEATEIVTEETTERQNDSIIEKQTEPQTEKIAEKLTEPRTEVSAEEKKAAEDIISEYNRGLLTYNEAVAQIEDSTSSQDGKEALNDLKASKEAYRKGNQYAEESSTLGEALEQYDQVIEEDINYEDAQYQMSDLRSKQVEKCRKDVNGLVLNQQYGDALKCIAVARQMQPENVELLSLWDQTISDYITYAISEADQLAGENKFDEAKAILDEAFADTGDETLQNKRNEIDELEQERARASVKDDEGIHQYELYYTDGTWNDAFASCINKGGYLVHINSQEELNYIISGLEAYGLRDTRFYIGARRELSDTNYYWVDENDNLYGTPINNQTGWLEGEPSLYDKNDSIQPVETVVEIFYSSTEKRWVLNDIPANLSDYLSTSNKALGFICEMEGGSETNVEVSGKWYIISNTYEEGIAVREGPSTDASLLCRIPYGTRFLVDGTSGVWGHTTVNGYTGWIHLDYAEEYDSSKDLSNKLYRISSDYEPGIAIRKEPSSDAELLCRIPNGTLFYVDEISGVWGHTMVNGYIGWIHLGYAEKVES